VEQLVPQVVSRRAHDTTAFTQGLEFVGDRLFESTGIHGESTTGLREIDPDTGEVIRRTDLGDPAYFGEGITEVDGRIVMLTWQDGLAFAFDVETFALAGTYAYLTEGWGLCHDGTRLVMSDGTSTLTFRDEDDFSEIGTVQVTLDGVPLNQLNELECVGGDVWANVWLTDQIVRIDPTTGAVTGVVDGSGLVDPHPQTVDPNAVLNGIAWDPDAETFLVTGKLWPEMVEVRFVPTEIAPPAASPASVQGSAGCAAEPPSPGVETLTLVSGGLERSYRRFVPTGAGSEPMPLVLNFHGFTSTADQQADNSGFEELGEREGVIVVHPQGSVLPSLGLTYWNIGLGDAVGPDAVDDVAFVSELLDTLEAELCVDPSRVYATGLSNGGYFSGLLACELADRFAAVAGVAAIFHPDGCAPSRMIPVLELHGTADIVVPFEGGDSVLAGSLLADTAEDPATAALIDAFFGMSMPGEMAEWALADGCDGTEPPLDAVAEQVSVRRFTGCEVSVEHYVIDGGTHTWFTLDNGGIDATATVWEFLTRHQLGLQGA
ncbi:MAG: glutaminyl-peptide cyclotransferase, partial [Acidimicrobiales bacterium]|nr:glutaminyl-peptide cyclotransferase [Acidimicrobiales bacterium]